MTAPFKFQVFVNCVAFGKQCDTYSEALTDAAEREHAVVTESGIVLKAPYVEIRSVKARP